MPVALEKWKTSLATGVGFYHEYRIRGADGVWRWMVAKGVREAPLSLRRTDSLIKPPSLRLEFEIARIK